MTFTDEKSFFHLEKIEFYRQQIFAGKCLIFPGDLLFSLAKVNVFPAFYFFSRQRLVFLLAT